MYKCLADEWLIFKNACSLPPATGASRAMSARHPFLAAPDCLPLPAPPTAISAHWLQTLGPWAGLVSYAGTLASDLCMKWIFVIWGKT